MPRPWEVLDTAVTDEGLLELRCRGGRDYQLTIADKVLMGSHGNESELALGHLGCASVAGRPKPRVLIGGLGMGYTLRATLDALPPDAQVTVVELNPVIESWCRGPLAALNGHALADPRVLLRMGDVAEHLAQCPPRSYDAILLDLYVGPDYETQGSHDPFYGIGALARTSRALAEGGVLAVWSEDLDPPFLERLHDAGFQVEIQHAGEKADRHPIYFARQR